MEASTNTPKRARTVRASHPANAFRQEPPGFSRVTFGFLGEDEVDHAVEDVALARDVVVQRHRLDAERLRELAHGEPVDAVRVGDLDGRGQGSLPAERGTTWRG